MKSFILALLLTGLSSGHATPPPEENEDIVGSISAAIIIPDLDDENVPENGAEIEDAP